jgi:predicted NBD/HSP70 family sugar kinase
MDYIQMSSAANAVLQNSINTSIILHYVRNNGESYRSEISKALNLSLPAVSRAVDQLLDRNIITEKRIITDTGKKAHEVEINASLGLFVGITVELPVIRFSRMDMAGNILDLFETSISTTITDLNQFIVDELGTYLQNKYVEDEAAPPVLAIGLALPAAVDLKNNTVFAVLFQRLKALPLQEYIWDKMGIPVLLENNENLAALAEKYYQDGVSEDSIVFITIHQGMGAGLILNGQLYRGANGAAGEIGCQRLGSDIRIQPEQSKTFENLASIHRIRKIAIDLIQSGEGEALFREANYDFESINHIFIGRLAAKGVDGARLVLERYTQVLAVGLANFLVTTNPQTMILGGDLIDIEDSEELILQPLRKYLEPLVPFPVPSIRMTRLGRDAAVIGAAQYALENTIFRDYPYILK